MSAASWSDLVFAHTRAGWLTLAALTSGLAALLAMLSRLRRPAARACGPAVPPVRPAAEAPPAAGLAETLNYEVDAVDALTEVEVFVEFGQLENAAQALRAYVEQYASHSRKHLQRLAELYLQLGQIHDYADTLASLHDQALLDRAQLEEAVLQGLRQDFNNLDLRLLAEQRLGLGMLELANLLGDAIETIILPPAADAPPESASAPAQTLASRSAPLTLAALVEGSRPLDALSRIEREVVSSLLPSERQARILLSCRDFRHALPVLEGILQLRPGSLSHRLDALYVHYQQRDLDGYCRTLWHFHVALGPYGARLKEQLVHAGLVMGSHPVLKQLAGRPDRPELERIGRQAGYAPPAAVRAAKTRLRLVEPTATAATDDQPDPLREAERYLEYGQTDQACKTLELAILASPEDATLYPLLLELYEKQDDLPRFTWLLRRMEEDGRQPPGEITLTLSAFVQSMQGRRHRGLAA